jgi:hypothetical protein
MQTDDLIAHLSASAAPVRGNAVLRQLALAVAVGIAASAVVMLLVLGPRPHMALVLSGFGMWMKLAYTLALAVTGFWIVERAGRPGASLARPALWLVLPVAAMAALAVFQLVQPGADVRLLVMGQSSRVCAFLVVLVALPVLAGTFWALRALAPTRLTLAGAGAGLLAGSTGAFVYCFHCPETAAPFVALWYSLGIALTAGIGALLGRATLRW